MHAGKNEKNTCTQDRNILKNCFSRRPCKRRLHNERPHDSDCASKQPTFVTIPSLTLFKLSYQSYQIYLDSSNQEPSFLNTDEMIDQKWHVRKKEKKKKKKKTEPRSQ